MPTLNTDGDRVTFKLIKSVLDEERHLKYQVRELMSFK